MGFLKLERDIPLNLNKATFSCFVFIPSSLASAVSSRDGGGLAAFGTRIMDHAVSLIMFGAQQTSIEYQTNTAPGNIGVCEAHTIGGTNRDVSGSFEDGNYSVAVQPSCIGISFPTGTDGITPTLYVNIQGANSPLTVGSSAGDGPGYTCHYGAGGNFDVDWVTIDKHDESYVNNLPQYAALGNAAPSAIKVSFSGLPTLLLDQWQHIILSWSLANESAEATEDEKASSGVTATSRMFCAINDVNKNGYDLPAGWPGQNDDPDFDPNACCSEITFSLGNEESSVADDYAPTMTLNYGTIPTNPIWIPGPPTLVCNDVNRGTSVAPNLGIITAHLQLFSGVLLDTSVEANRRLFLASDGKPADPKAAQNALGKKPAIQFIKSKDWIDGKNKGSAGNFTKNGTVAVHTPGPGG